MKELLKEATLWIAIGTAALYFLGIQCETQYLKQFDLSVHQFLPDTSIILTSGFNVAKHMAVEKFWLRWVILLLILAFILCLLYVGSDKHKKLMVTAALILAPVGYYFLLASAQVSGVNQALGMKSKIRITLSNCDKPIEGGYVAARDGTYAVRVVDETGPHTMLVRADQIQSIKIWESVETTKSAAKP